MTPRPRSSRSQYPGGTLLQKYFKIRSWVPSPQMPYCKQSTGHTHTTHTTKTKTTQNSKTAKHSLLAGGFPRVLFPPLWCFPPRCAGAVSPLVVFPPAVCGGCASLRSSDPLVASLLSWVRRSSLRASGRWTWAGSSLADAGAPQLHALAPLQQRRWPAHRPAHVMVAPRSSRPAQRRADFPRQRNTTRTPRPPSPARQTRFRSGWPRS